MARKPERQPDPSPMRLRAWAGRLVLAVAWLLAGTAASAGVAPDPVALAARIHDEVNLARRAHGLPPLAWEAPLAGIAAAHSTDMARRHYFSHASPEGQTMRERYAAGAFECRVQRGDDIHLGAENIAMHTLYARVRIDAQGRRRHEWLDDAALARKVVAAWLDSAGHRSNLLAPHWQREGIGLAFNADDEVFVTQNFC